LCFFLISPFVLKYKKIILVEENKTRTKNKVIPTRIFKNNHNSNKMKKIALITGATSGIGKATALLLSKNNYD